MVAIPVVQEHEDLPLPSYAKDGDAGMDLVASEDAVIGRGKRGLVSTGLSVAIPEGYAGFIQPRSGLAYKHGVTVLNAPGLIDSGYRGELKVLLFNACGADKFIVNRGDRIAQLVIQKVEQATLTPVDELPSSKRGKGGFGSTGVAAEES